MFLSSCIFYLLKELSLLQQESSLRTADVFPVAASLRPEIRQLFAGQQERG